jgi:hypothetical protein
MCCDEPRQQRRPWLREWGGHGRHNTEQTRRIRSKPDGAYGKGQQSEPDKSALAKLGSDSLGIGQWAMLRVAMPARVGMAHR